VSKQPKEKEEEEPFLDMAEMRETKQSVGIAQHDSPTASSLRCFFSSHSATLHWLGDEAGTPKFVICASPNSGCTVRYTVCRWICTGLDWNISTKCRECECGCAPPAIIIIIIYYSLDPCAQVMMMMLMIVGSPA
jgi:hypothetical protein